MKKSKVLNISDLLHSLNLPQYVEVLEKENIDKRMLVDPKPEKLMEMFRNFQIPS